MIEQLRAARGRLRKLSRRVTELEDRRDVAARELKDEIEQVLIGLDLLGRHRPSAPIAAFAARLKRTAERIQGSLSKPAKLEGPSRAGGATGSRLKSRPRRSAEESPGA